MTWLEAIAQHRERTEHADNVADGLVSNLDEHGDDIGPSLTYYDCEKQAWVEACVPACSSITRVCNCQEAP